MTDTLNLLPCPFCGGEAQIHENSYDAFWALCDGCGLATSETGVATREEASLRWNTRAPVSQGEIRFTKEEWADHILANFKTEDNRTKAEEWEASYAMLFKQFTDVCGQKRESDGSASG
jgi:hypothetical protein